MPGILLTNKQVHHEALLSRRRHAIVTIRDHNKTPNELLLIGRDLRDRNDPTRLRQRRIRNLLAFTCFEITLDRLDNLSKSRTAKMQWQERYLHVLGCLKYGQDAHRHQPAALTILISDSLLGYVKMVIRRAHANEAAKQKKIADALRFM